MKEKLVSGLVTAAAAVLALALLGWWVSLSPAQTLALRTGEDKTGASSKPPPKPIDLKGTFASFDGVPATLPGAWSRFRGEAFDNVNRDPVGLAEVWEENGPPLLWSVDLGEGYAGPAVRNGRVFVLDYDEQVKGDALRCFSLEDGREIWRRTYKILVKKNHGMSRTVPAVTDRYVVTVGPKCHVLCADAASGEFKWGLDLAAAFGTTIPLWYTGQCPVIDGGTAVLAPGGEALMIGVDCETGRIVWRTPNPHGWRMSHSCIIPMTLCGVRTYVYCALGGVIGVSAEAKDRGAVLWETTAWKPAVVAPSPVALKGNRFLVTAGYGSGSMVFQVEVKGDRFSVTPVATWDKKVFACEQHTPIFYEGRLYSILPKDAGPLRGQVVCMRPDGRHVWTSGKKNRFELGPFLIADDKMFILNDDGVLTLIDLSKERFLPLARAKVLTGHEAWGPLALVNGRLILRDERRMICLDVKAR
ncbi:MAG: outer membrane protein assembly factor BamB family protein [Planctomycetota bacterium]|jgi:outer membrane protein assembly factor BamB